MASEAEASCESDPNFAIICAFMEKFGESCGIPSIDFIELQQMLENNQEVSPELMNLHIKLLRKTKKNVTVERWERALINMCHTFSSKDAWEIERFGYKKTRLPIKLRALKELLEMQFDFNTKFKNEVNKMTAEELRSQPLGRDKLGRAYWFQTDNNYQIRIYKEDPDEETWNLIAKDRGGLLSLITELSDGDSKFSSDSACNEDSNSLLEKPLIDTGQNENSIENKMKEIEDAQKGDERTTSDTISNFELPSETPKLELDDSSKIDNSKSNSEKKSVISEQEPAQNSVEELKVEEVEPKKEETTEIRRPMLRIKSLSELMEKPKEPPTASFLPDLPELTITKKPKVELPEITIVKKQKMQPRMRTPIVSPAIESPVMIIRGNGSGRDNKCGNRISGEVEPVQFEEGSGSKRVVANNDKSINDKRCDEVFIGDEIEEPVMYIIGRGTGVDCQTGNEKDASKVHSEDERSKSSNACAPSQEDTGETAKQIPTSHLSNIKLGTVIDSKTDTRTFLPRSPNKKSRWDQKELQGSEMEEKIENNLSPKKMTFFFGPGSLNVKPNSALNSSSDDLQHEYSDKMLDDTENNIIRDKKESETVQEVHEDNEALKSNDVPLGSESLEKNGSTFAETSDINSKHNNECRNPETTISPNEEKENCSHTNAFKEELIPSSLHTDSKSENATVCLASDVESDHQNFHCAIEVNSEKEKLKVECDQDQQNKNLNNVRDQGKHEEKFTNESGDTQKENLQNECFEDTSTKGVTNDIKENEKEQNEIKMDTQNELEHIEPIREEHEESTEVITLNDEEKECKQQDEKSITIENKLLNVENEIKENNPAINESSGEICDETKVEETLEEKSQADNASPNEIILGQNDEIVSNVTKPIVSENLKGIEADEQDVSRENECVSKSSLLKSNPSDISNRRIEMEQIIHQNIIDKDSENLTNKSAPKYDIEPVESKNESEAEKTSKQKDSVRNNIDQSCLDNENNLSDEQKQVEVDDKKAEALEDSKIVKPSELTVSADNYLDASPIKDEKLSENKKADKIVTKKTEDEELCDAVQLTNSNKIGDRDMEVTSDEHRSMTNEESEPQANTKKMEKESLKGKKKAGKAIKSTENSEVDVMTTVQETDDKSSKQGTSAEISSSAVDTNKEIETIEPPLKDVDEKKPLKLSKANTEDVSPSKKRKGRKVISDSKKIISEDIPEDVGNTSVRSVRQTRQTRAAALAEATPPIPLAKGRGRKKAPPKTTRSDETESTDSPIPLESVTVNDVDNNSAAADNTETDPLAVSDEDLENASQPISSITSFSFDYDPNSPVPQLPGDKKNRRKRGRESLENKPDAGETLGKKAKMKGKRTVDLTLRKSVEEKRQKEVGDASSDDNESVESPIKKKEVKMKKRGPPKKNSVTPTVSDSDNSAQKLKSTSKRNSRLLKNLGVKEEDISALEDSPAPVRQSRRLAQIKIKEDAATRRKIEDDDVATTRKKKKKKEDDKDFKGGKRKRIEEELKPAPTPPMVEKKKRKKKKHNKISIGWNTSSEDSENSGKEEEVSEYEYEEPREEEPLQFKSDHEFSPESDLEGDEQLPHKRARTARKEESDDGETEEEFPCKKCGKSDHPEWILLCDKCDNGWHCSCLRPALFVIPEGDWYCPTCQHDKLLEKLHEKLVEFDKLLVKKGMEDRRKERLAYVGISLNNVLPAKDKKDKVSHKSSGSSVDVSESESASGSADGTDSDEPIYQLRQRRQAHSYKFQDYDDLINSALQEEPSAPVEKTHTLGRGKDIATIVNAAKEDEERNAENNGFEDLPPVVPKDISDNKKKALSYRKKPKRLNNLEVNSDDEADDSDEDFKGSSSSESEEDDFEGDSDDSFVGRKSSRPVRRSTRARITRYDADFINDDSDNASRKKKKKKVFSDDSESEESDDWRGRKKKQRKMSPFKKSKKKKKRFDDSDLETYRKKKPKIKYGIDSDDDTKGRRTRGKRTSYLDTLGSDSEEEALKKKSKDKSEDEEYVAEDEEKESEDEFDAPLEKDSEENEESREGMKANSDNKNSDSEEEALIVKKLKINKKRAFIDSEDEEENSTEIPQKIDSEAKVEKSHSDIVEEPELDKYDQVVPKKNDDIKSVENEEMVAVKNDDVMPEKSEETRQLERKALEKPPSVVVPILNVEKLKACGITLTKVSKEKLEDSLNTDDAKSPSNLMEIGVKPVVPTLIQKNKQSIPPVAVERIERNLEGFNNEEVEKTMDNEESNKQFQMTSTEVRSNLIKEEFDSSPVVDETKNFVKSPFSIMSNRKLGDNSLKKFRTGRFFNMKTPQEPLMSRSVSLGMSNDDNDELSEPPGVALPLFSEIGPSSIQSIPKSSIISRIPRNCTPPPIGHNRIMPMITHNVGPVAPQVSLPMNVPVNSPYPQVLNSPAGRLSNSVGPTLGPTSISNIPNSTNNPVGGPTAPNIPVVVNMPLVHRSKSTTPPSSISPDGTPKKRRGRGKGKKTLAAEAAAAAAAAGLPLPEAVKTSPNKSLTPNIEIASPPQPFSQSQPAPSVITRMLQSSPGKGAFPVGRIRPKQFAMMPDVDNENEGSSSMDSHGDGSLKDVPHPPRSNHPPGQYTTPVSSQFPPSYYQKQSHGPPAYHLQRLVQPSMHSYPPHPPPTSIDPASHNSPALSRSPLNQQPVNQPPMNQPTINQPMNQMNQSLVNQPPINQPTINPPPISQTPINLSGTTPPPMGQYSSTSPGSKPPYDPLAHRPSSYGNTSSGYGYDYNAAATSNINTDEVVHPTSYENPTAYSEQYENSGSSLDTKNIEDEPSGEFGGLVSYFSSQHEDDLDS